jgi:hypothetical protein
MASRKWRSFQSWKIAYCLVYINIPTGIALQNFLTNANYFNSCEAEVKKSVRHIYRSLKAMYGYNNKLTRGDRYPRWVNMPEET